MTVSNATHPATSQPLQANMRSAADFRRANRHSRLVTLLKGILPVFAFFLSAGFVASAVTSYTPLADLALNNVGLKDGKLVMEQPKMAGYDKNNRPFDVKATTASQDVNTPDIIELVSIDAKLPMDAKSFANVDARQGTYNTQSETLNLREEVTIKGARGMDIELEEADFNMKTGTMVSDKPVNVTSGETKISAQSVVVEDNGKRVIFKERVKMTIIRPVTRGTEAANAAN